jgi:PleD family two-component response regulator
MSDPASPKHRRPVLDSMAFRDRLDEEVERVRKGGGFLSLALVGLSPAAAADRRPPPTVARVAEMARRAARREDILAERAQRLAVLMPETAGNEAEREIERLLAVINEADAGRDGRSRSFASAGLATTYGEVEGGGTALLAAAEGALRDIAPGRVARSQTLAGRPRILVVDDDLTFAQTLAETISERDWEAHPCTDVADARQRVLDLSYSGFFIDVVLRGCLGSELLADVMSIEPRRPAVLMSGQDLDPVMLREALAFGPVMFMAKPMTLADIESALDMFRRLVPGVRHRGGPGYSSSSRRRA